MKNQKGFTLVELVIALFILFSIFSCIAGWGINIVKLTRCDFQPPYKAEIIRSVGLVPIVGAVVGWIDIEDKPINQ